MSYEEAPEFARTKPAFEHTEDEPSGDESEIWDSSRKDQSRHCAGVQGGKKWTAPNKAPEPQNGHFEHDGTRAEMALTTMRRKPFIILNDNELEEFRQTVESLLESGPANWHSYFQHCWPHRIDIETKFGNSINLLEKCKSYFLSIQQGVVHKYVEFWITDRIPTDEELSKYSLHVHLMVKVYITCFRSYGMARYFSEEGSRLLSIDDGILEYLFDLRLWELFENLSTLISVLKYRDFSLVQRESIEKAGTSFVDACRGLDGGL